MAENNQQQPNSAASDTISDDEWMKKEHGGVLSYCSRNDLVVSGIIQSKSAILPPIIGVWLVDSKVNQQQYWVISGDLPLDHIAASNAKNARDAIRHFALRWQLKAEKLMTQNPEEKILIHDREKQSQFAEMLISKANGLYELYEDEKLWGK